MQKLKTIACAMLLPMALAGCESLRSAQPIAVECPKPPAPPAWTLTAPSNSLQLLDETFSISAQE